MESRLIEELPRLETRARALARDLHLAEDAVQETALIALSRAGDLRDESRLTGWLLRILQNALRGQYRRMRHETSDPESVHASRLCEPARQDNHVTCGELLSALTRLPHCQRDALTLVGIEGLGAVSAAGRLGVAPSTVRTRVYRARSTLRALT